MDLYTAIINQTTYEDPSGSTIDYSDYTALTASSTPSSSLDSIIEEQLEAIFEDI